MPTSTKTLPAPTELLNGNIDGLTDKQSRFVLHYIDCHNLTEAVARAGYKGTRAYWANIGSRLIRVPKVTKAIREQLHAQAERSLITPDRLLYELARIAFFDPSDCIGDEGEVLSVKDMPPNIRHAIAGIDVEEKTEWVNGKRVKVGEVKKIRFYNKLDALGKLMAHYGMTPKRTDLNISAKLEATVEHKHSIALGNLSEDELSTLLKLTNDSQAKLDLDNKELIVDGSCKHIVEDDEHELPEDLQDVISPKDEDLLEGIDMDTSDWDDISDL